MTQIRQIFDEMRNIAFNHRMAMITFDGQAFWHKIKKLLAPYDNESFEWQPVKNDYLGSDRVHGERSRREDND